MTYPIQRFGILPVWLLFIGFISSMTVYAQDAPPPPRVARLSHVEGNVSIWTQNDDEWQAAVINTPIMEGDKVYAGLGSRAELDLGDDVFVRLDQQGYVSLPIFNEEFVRLEAVQGSMSIHKRAVEYPRPPLEVLSANFLATLDEPVNARIDINPSGAEISVQSGRLNVNIDQERFIRVERGDKMVAPTPDPDTYTKLPIGPQDSFDQWVDVRDAATASIAREPRVSQRISGYRDLDRYGEWVDTSDYGTVWRPTVVVDDWAPYRYGYWSWRGAYGWTWVSYEPWGWAPYHYGRWVHVKRYNWVWVPHEVVYVNSYYRRPYWYPALVSFSYSSRGSSFSFAVSSGYYSDPYVGWFPLGVHDPYYWSWGYYYDHHRYRHYDIDYHFHEHHHHHYAYDRPRKNYYDGYDYQNGRVRNAVTVMPRADFERSVYDRKAPATIQTSARREVAVGQTAMSSLPRADVVQAETRQTRLAMKQRGGAAASPARVDSSFENRVTSSKPRQITMAEPKERVVPATVNPRLQEAETPRKTAMTSPEMTERRVATAERSTLEPKARAARATQGPRDSVSERVTASQRDSSNPRAVSAPRSAMDARSSRSALQASPSRGAGSPSAEANGIDRTRRPTMQAPEASVSRSPREANPAQRSRSGLEQRQVSPRRDTSQPRNNLLDRSPYSSTSSRVQRNEAQVPDSRAMRERSASPRTEVRNRSTYSTSPSRAQQLRSQQPLQTPDSRAMRQRSGATRNDSTMNWSQPARRSYYDIQTSRQPRAELERSRVESSPSRSSSALQGRSGSISTPRNYNLQNRSSVSVSPQRESSSARNRSSYSNSRSRSVDGYQVPSSERLRLPAVQPPTRSSIDASPSRTTQRNSYSPPTRSESRSYDVSPSRSTSRSSLSSPSRSISPSRSSLSSPSRSISPSRSSLSSPSRSSISPSRSSSSPSLSRPSSSPSRAQSLRSSSPSRSSVGTSKAARLRSP